MPFTRPTLLELIARAEADIESRLPGTDAKLRRSNLNVLARAHSGAAHGLYGYLAWAALQVLPDTAEAEVLDRHARLWLSTPRIPAAYAVGQVTATGVNGTVIPAGTVFKRADGAEYESDAEATIVAGTATVAVTAVEAGQAGNAVAATTLALTTPIAGLTSTVTVTAGALTGGADVEDDDSLRDRVVARMHQAPHGGADFDYPTWAREVAGVTRAWVYPLELGAGTVTVRFVRDDDATPIPDAAEVAAVQAYIDARRPVTADVSVVAPIADPLDFTIQLSPDTAATRAAVEAELRDLLKREAEPGGTILLSHVREAISIAAGETDHVMTAPVADVAHATGHMATFGVITWA